jgi:hypothetical protein
MKPYNGSRRTLLKVGAHSKKLLDTVKEEARAALLSEDLKTKYNKISIGLNAPENPKTVFKVNLNLGGPERQKIADNLFDSYKDTCDKKKEHKRFVEGWRKESDDVLFVELKFRVKSGSAQKHAQEIQEYINSMMAIIPESEDEIYFLPRVHAIDENTIGMGQKIHFPRSIPAVDEEFHAVLNHAGQHLHLTAELGTSIEEIMSSDEPMLKSLAKGFKITHTQCLIGNMKKLLLELSKTEDETKKMFAMQALMVAPATML